MSNAKQIIWLWFAGTITFMAIVLYLHIHETARQGTVAGILYTFENSTAIIDGVIVEEGSSLYGVNVEKINRKTVEFEKDGIKWEQRVGERPNLAWKQQQQPKDGQTP